MTPDSQKRGFCSSISLVHFKLRFIILSNPYSNFNFKEGILIPGEQEATELIEKDLFLFSEVNTILFYK